MSLLSSVRQNKMHLFRFLSSHSTRPFSRSSHLSCHVIWDKIGIFVTDAVSHQPRHIIHGLKRPPYVNWSTISTNISFSNNSKAIFLINNVAFYHTIRRNKNWYKGKKNKNKKHFYVETSYILFPLKYLYLGAEFRNQSGQHLCGARHRQLVDSMSTYIT